MKFLCFGKRRPAPVARPRQPLMQPLEPRRLMSLTAAPDFPTDAQTLAPIVHSFGFENLLPPPPRGGLPFSHTPIFASVTADSSGDEAEAPRADAQTSLMTAPAADNTAVPTASVAVDNSLSAMYATLDKSTVAAIDDAAGSTTGAVNPQTSFAHALESDLQSVSRLAREMVSQMGRDLAIELAHIEAAADAAVIEQLKSWDGRGIAVTAGAAVAAAAVAAAAYLQSESKTDETKAKSVFSSLMIEPSGA